MTTPLTEKAIADKVSFARSSGAWSAWAELLRRFDYKQRQHLANLLAHQWTIKELTLESCYGSGEDTLNAKIGLDKVSFPSRGEEDPKISEMTDNEKAVAALMADNQRLRARATSSEEFSKSLETDVLALITTLSESLKNTPIDNKEALSKIAEFKESYFV